MIADLELAMVDAAELAGVLAVAPAMPAGLASWWAPRWNVAPTQPVRAIVARDDGPRLTLARWAITPPKGRTGKRPPPLINARAETAAGSGLFKKAMAQGRCLVVADGFYEWRGEAKAKVPVRFAPPGDQAITFAAIARRREHEGLALDELAILTCAADPLVAALHDRRPVVIDPADRVRWLDPGLPVDAIADLLAPPPFAGWTATDAPVWINAARTELAASPDAPPRELRLPGF